MAGDGEVLRGGTEPGLCRWGARGDGGHFRTRSLCVTEGLSLVPPFQLLHPLRGRAPTESEVQDTSHEKCIFGGLWAAVGPRWGSYIRPGGERLYCSGGSELRATRLHLSFTFFGKTCFGVCSLESIPAFWSGHQRTGAMRSLWSAGALSLCPRVRYSQKRQDSKACITGAKRTREIFRAEVFKDFPQVEFSSKWGISGRTPYAVSLWPYFWLWLILQHLLCIF